MNPTAADMLNVPAAVPGYLRYVTYELHATFESVPYALLPDADIVVQGGSWKDDNGTLKTFSYADEYFRFIDWPRFPAAEFLQFRHGQMMFRTASGNKPDGFPMPGLARVPMRKKLLKAMWYRVPESYVNHAKSYLDRFLWRVNQNDVEFGGETYKSGELLYAGYAFPKRNNPPFPPADPLFPGYFTTSKILDIELTFSVCRFADPDAPAPANGNWIAAGHNLDLHAADRLPHYVTTEPSPPDLARRYPKYWSAPFELLFTDPAFDQDIGFLRD